MIPVPKTMGAGSKKYPAVKKDTFGTQIAPIGRI